MSSNSGAMRRIGAQEPRLRLEPKEQSYTDGQDAVELMEEYSFTPDKWQGLLLDAWLARDSDDRFTYTTCGLSCPRQNGKNGTLDARELYGMVINGEKILHTAHQVKTSKRSFRGLSSIFTDKRHPDLCELVTDIRRTNGEEAIYLSNGGSIEYSARSRGATRGWTVDTVVYDEAQELTDDQVEAIMSTLAAAPSGNRQLIYTGTPPGPNSPGEVFRRVRKAALDGSNTRECWHEWSVEEIGDVDDRDRWYDANPALGIRLDEEFTEQERSTLSEDGFARERLGWWSERRASAAIPKEMWDACAVSKDDAARSGKKAFGVKFSLDGSQVALCACRLPENGSAHCDLVGIASLAEGIGWLDDFLCNEERADSTAAIAVDGRNGADALLNKLREVYPHAAIVEPGPRGVIAAANMTLESLRDRALTHWDDPDGGQSALDESALSCSRRPIGQGGGWGFGGDNSAAIEAMSFAYFAAKTTKRNPEGGCVLA